jgi:hypothetical protein
VGGGDAFAGAAAVAGAVVDCGCGAGCGTAAAEGAGVVVTVGVVTVGVGTVGVGTVGVGTVGAGTIGCTGSGTGRVGTGGIGTGRGGRSTALAVNANTPAPTIPTTPKIRRTPIQLRGGRTGFGLRSVLFAAMRFEQDYYDVLGVGRDASGEEIKRAFRGLVRRFHPDVATEPEAGSFHDVVAAYEVLSHPRKRSLYDRLGLSRRRPAARPAPAAPPIELQLEWYEAERGVSRQVEFEELVACAGCAGRGVPQGVVAAECVTCRGSGRLSKVTESTTLRLLEFNVCSACGGTGRAAAPLCLDCGGSGSTTSLRSLRLRVPAGVDDGDLIQVEGIDRRFHLNVTARPRDSSAVLLLAGIALACALGLLAFLLLR